MINDNEGRCNGIFGACPKSPGDAISGLGGEFLRTLLNHLVDQSEVLGHVGGQEVIPLQGILDLLDRLASVLDVNLVEPLLQV